MSADNAPVVSSVPPEATIMRAPMKSTIMMAAKMKNIITGLLRARIFSALAKSARRSCEAAAKRSRS